MTLLYLLVLLFPSLISAAWPQNIDARNVRSYINCLSIDRYKSLDAFAVHCWTLVDDIDNGRYRNIHKNMRQSTIQTSQGEDTGVLRIELGFKSCSLGMTHVKKQRPELWVDYDSTTWADIWLLLGNTIRSMMEECVVKKNTGGSVDFAIDTSTPEPFKIRVSIVNSDSLFFTFSTGEQNDADGLSGVSSTSEQPLSAPVIQEIDDHAAIAIPHNDPVSPFDRNTTLAINEESA